MKTYLLALLLLPLAASAYPVWTHIENHTNHTLESIVDTSQTVCMGDVNSRLQDLTVAPQQSTWYDPNVNTSFDGTLSCFNRPSSWVMKIYNKDTSTWISDVTCIASDGNLQRCAVTAGDYNKVHTAFETNLQWRIDVSE